MSAKERLKDIIPDSLMRRLSSARRQKRREAVEASPFYQRYGAKTDALIVDTRARVSTERSYVYFRIPKAANSTMAANMLHYEEGVTASRDVVEGFKKTSRRLSSLSDTEVNDLLSGYFKFTVVRNPYSRFLSAYFDKIHRRTPHSEVVARFLKKGPSETISISEFLGFLEAPEGVDSDGHWARQTDIIALPVENLDFIGRCETMPEDMPVMMQRLYGRFEEVPNFSPHATGADKKLDACSEQDLQRIYRIYEKDFDLLKYPNRNSSLKNCT